MESIEGPFAPPTPSGPRTRTAPTVVIALVLTVVVSIASLGLVVVIATRDHEKLTLPVANEAVGPMRGDHWHAAFGVYDCGHWVPNWGWPPGVQLGVGGPARAG